MPAPKAPSTKASLSLRWGLLLPLLAVSVLSLAGSAVTRATIGAPTSTGTSVSVGMVVGIANPALENFCEHNWGELSDDGSLCRFTQRFHLNLGHVGGRVVLTDIPVVPLDTLKIEASSPPEVIVGDKAYGLGGESLRVSSAGYLSFRAAAGQAIFSVQRVTLERCYAWSGSAVGSVPCATPSSGTD